MTAGKGSRQRPQQVPDEQVSDSWNTIFNKEKKDADSEHDSSGVVPERIPSDIPANA